MLLDDLIEEIQELEKIKVKYNHLLVDKEQMSGLLFELMTEKYSHIPYEERVEEYKREFCHDCRFNFCGMKFPENIGQPVKSDKGWIPSTVGCGKFEWD